MHDSGGSLGDSLSSAEIAVLADAFESNAYRRRHNVAQGRVQLDKLVDAVLESEHEQLAKNDVRVSSLQRMIRATELA